MSGLRSVFIFSILVLFSCKKQEAGSMLEEDVFVEVLHDLHIAEAALQGLDPTTKDSLGNLYYDQTFTIHNITEEEFESSMLQLREDPILIDRIYEKVLDELSERSNQYK